MLRIHRQARRALPQTRPQTIPQPRRYAVSAMRREEPSEDHPRDAFTIVRGDSPLVAAAVHDGHEIRPDVAEQLALSDRERRREEDPHTGLWTKISDSRIVARRSRFEVDLNRPREQAVYRRPADAWGLEVWESEPSEALVRRSLAEYDAFYEAVEELLAWKAKRHGQFVVYDIHSYNHMREGPDGPPADPAQNPDINVGTGSMDRQRWAPIVDRLIADLRSVDFLGRKLDVRENVNFTGGEFPAWVHRTFPVSGCAVALEFKKFFMDEWTGHSHEKVVRAIEHTLQFAAAGTLEVLASS